MVIQGRFGPELAVYCKDRKGNGYPVGYFMIGSKTYRVSVNKNPNSKREGVEAILNIREFKQNQSYGGGAVGRRGL